MPYDHKAHRVFHFFLTSKESCITTLYLQELYTTKQIHKIKFEELNFFHNKCFCTKDYVKATWDFLLAENSQNLKKLSIKSCVLQSTYTFVKNVQLLWLTYVKFLEEFISKNQIAAGNLISLRKYPLADIIENCPLVNTLELMQCPRWGFVVKVIRICFQFKEDFCSSCNVTIIDAYPLISKWKHLEKVTLELPPHVTGSFLIEVSINSESA